jgi:HD-GYP domain-containing protein (c-di-GMP phosphodiesterase class II)
MRYILAKNIRKGMVLACNLFDEKLACAYQKGQKLKSGHVEKIVKAGYPGTYIHASSADEITPEPLISEEVYIGVAGTYMAFLKQAGETGSGKSFARFRYDDLKKIIQPVVEEMCEKNEKNMMVDTFDLKPFAGYNCYHAVSVMLLSLLIGRRLNLPEGQLYELGLAALFCDLGTVFLPPELLNRPGELTDEEFALIKGHVKKGSDYLREYCDLPTSACAGAMQHHESYDGTGYPEGLKRKNISLYGRIISIADVYDALVSKRAFRQAMYPGNALEVVQQMSDRKFDPDLIDALEKVIAPYPTGSLVKLKTGESCIVVRNYTYNIRRPKLRIWEDENSASHDYIDLHFDVNHAGNKIVKLLE